MEQINEKVGLHASSTVAVVVISPYYNDLLRHNVQRVPQSSFFIRLVAYTSKEINGFSCNTLSYLASVLKEFHI
jgi:hypothetical protein